MEILQTLIAKISEELRTLIIDCVMSCLVAHQEQTPPSNQSSTKEGQLLTKEEAAKLAAVSPSTIANWARSGKLPKYRLGSSVRYKLDELIALVDSMKENPSNTNQLNY